MMQSNWNQSTGYRSIAVDVLGTTGLTRPWTVLVRHWTVLWFAQLLIGTPPSTFSECPSNTTVHPSPFRAMATVHRQLAEWWLFPDERKAGSSYVPRRSKISQLRRMHSVLCSSIIAMASWTGRVYASMVNVGHSQKVRDKNMTKSCEEGGQME